MSELLKGQIASLFRKALFAVGALVVQHGITTAEVADSWVKTTAEILAGLVVTFFPVVWSWIRAKFFAKKAEETAILTNALANELAPAEVKTSPRADAIINKLVIAATPSLPEAPVASVKVADILAKPVLGKG